MCTEGRQCEDAELEDSHVTGMMSLHTKECRGWPAKARSWKRQGHTYSPLEPVRESVVLLMPWFQISNFQNCKIVAFHCLSYNAEDFVTAALGN